MQVPTTPTPIQLLEHSLLKERNVKLWIKRDDLTHPHIMGNKWRKLKYIIDLLKNQELVGIETFGGAYSNHLVAVAAAGLQFGFKTKAYVRGDELSSMSNPTLQFAASCGMALYFISRNEYRDITQRQTIDIGINQQWITVPEGGTTRLCLKGCKEMVEELEQLFDYYCVPVGTGGTVAGILNAIQKKGTVLAFSALKGAKYVESILNRILELGAPIENLRIYEDRRFGGYSNFNPELLQFILGFRQDFRIVLDPIYTAKMAFNVWEMIKNGEIAEGSKVLLVHTGGLQGIVGFNYQHGLQLPTE